MDGERRLVRANDVTYIPPGVMREFSNIGIDPLVFLAITAANRSEPRSH